MRCHVIEGSGDKILHRELEQLFAGTQDGNREAREQTGDTSGGTCLAVEGKSAPPTDA